MTDIEFLVRELRKATEKIDTLLKENEELKGENDMLIERNLKLSSDMRSLKKNWGINKNVNLGDIDALAVLKKKMEGEL